ncbi:hypothetical protein HDU76_012470 [Blyttiomyces sp. JEL0837]|nr:hypothetical protein HDU76_012470 [Blyttiomyces sp. JEL0837]
MLDPCENGAVSAYRCMIDDLNNIMVYWRWLVPANTPFLNEKILPSVPWPIRWLVIFFTRRRAQRSLWAGGMGRHSREQLLAMADEFVTALSALLGLDDFMMGTEEPTSLDCAAYGVLANMLLCDLPDNEFARKLFARPNLIRFVRKMTAGWFKEFVADVDWDQLEEKAKALKEEERDDEGFDGFNEDEDGEIEYEEHGDVDDVTANDEEEDQDEDDD